MLSEAIPTPTVASGNAKNHMQKISEIVNCKLEN